MDENKSLYPLQYIQGQPEQLQKLIKERVAERPRKVPLCANLGLVKPRAIINSSNLQPDKRTDIYANFDLYPVIC